MCPGKRKTSSYHHDRGKLRSFQNVSWTLDITFEASSSKVEQGERNLANNNRKHRAFGYHLDNCCIVKFLTYVLLSEAKHRLKSKQRMKRHYSAAIVIKLNTKYWQNP